MPAIPSPVAKKTLPAAFALFVLILQAAGASAGSAGLAPQKAADLIHAVIDADRTIYSEYIVERLDRTIGLQASEQWEKENKLPLPAQFLLLAANMLNERNVGLNYRLLSLWPINKNNGPKSAFEKTGLEAVARHPEKPHSAIVTVKGKRFFKTVYADRAVTKICVTCHNGHPQSPRHDFTLDSVMGGIIITLPLGNDASDAEKPPDTVPPEVVADYIHAILEADRTVYSSHIVNRLQTKKISYATEHWWEEDALLLPVQFLLNASDLINHRQIQGLDFKLIGLWPINGHNKPANEFERRGLEYVAQNPARPYVNLIKRGGRQYFQGIYPDFAANESCVTCHNNHRDSPRRDFTLNSVMGGIVITLSIE